jgi:DNA-binding MarR family transcriptional regulator
VSADQLPIPALLRAARGAYAYEIIDRLKAAGFGDLPRNGPFVIGGLARYGQSLAGIVADLGVTRQAASQLVETLVRLDYVVRTLQSEDRRRLNIELTDRGRAAAAVIRSAVETVDAQLHDRIDERDLAGLRRGLAALAQIRAEHRSGGTGEG